MIEFVLLLAAVTTADSRNSGDAASIGVYRKGMQAITRDLSATPANGTKLPSRQERENARLMWRSFLDYELALESIRAANSDFLTRTGGSRNRAFRLYYAAWLAQYSGALQFIDAADRHPEYHTILNEHDPTLGLTRGTYSDFKLRWLNVARAAEFATFALLDRSIGGKNIPGANEDAQFILAAGKGSGPQQTARNAARIVQTAVWEPVPAGLAAIAGGEEKPAPRPPYISPLQISGLRRHLEPGDLIFERRDWALSNVGLPGFWPHVALYVGTPAERKRAFGASAAPEDPRFAHVTVVEAIGEGVIANTFERSADADYVAVVRPNVPAQRKAEAIHRAFGYVGRPYDFDFDYATDDRIVCTELVYKAYEGALHLPVMRLAGRSVTPANDFVRWFDEQFDRGRELAFVGFLDAHANRHTAFVATASDLRASWRRPRWYSAVDR